MNLENSLFVNIANLLAPVKVTDEKELKELWRCYSGPTAEFADRYTVVIDGGIYRFATMMYRGEKFALYEKEGDMTSTGYPKPVFFKVA